MLKLMTSNKDIFLQEREMEISQLVEQVENGEREAIVTYAHFKRLKDLYDNGCKLLHESALNEAENWTEKSFDHKGFKFEKRNGATRYDYKHIPEWQEAKETIRDIEDKAKYAFLSKQKGLLSATEQGEEITLPKVLYSKDSLVVK